MALKAVKSALMFILKQVALSPQNLKIKFSLREEVSFNVGWFGCVFLGTPAQVNIELYFFLVVV